MEDWRALVTEDILTETKTRFEGTRSKNPLERRHTMNLADTISNNLASLNIFGGMSGNSEKQATKLSEQKQKVSELLCECSSYSLARVETGLPTAAADSGGPAYLKCGPGQVDFGYIAMEELIEVMARVC